MMTRPGCGCTSCPLCSGPARSSAARTSCGPFIPRYRTSRGRCCRAWPTSWPSSRPRLLWCWTTITSSAITAATTRSPSCCRTSRPGSSDNRFIVDFLAEEVLSRQPAEIRQFLTRTAVLGRFCAPLCDAVTGSANAAEIIEIIERDNLFLVPLDDNRLWYRFHHLFAHVLLGQLGRCARSASCSGPPDGRGRDRRGDRARARLPAAPSGRPPWW